VGRLDRGGGETWLMHVLRNIDRERFKIDFLVHSAEPAAYDGEARDLGAEVIPCLHPRRPLLYRKNFLRIMRENSYDAVHSHVHHFSGYALRLAAGAGVPLRIAHSHSDTRELEREAGLARSLYLALMKSWINKYAGLGLAASSQAASALFGPEWKDHPGRRVLYCGIDLSAFEKVVDRAEARKEFGMPADAFVIGHVGSLIKLKNHSFILDVLGEALKRDDSVRLLLVGDGPERPSIMKKSEKLGVADKVTLAGSRADAPRLMKGAMDVAVLPSLREGLPLVGLEAQAAGLPLVLSDLITGEVDVVAPLIFRMALSEGAGAWADACLRRRGRRPPVAGPEALELMRSSPFDIRAAVKSLAEIYSARR